MSKTAKGFFITGTDTGVGKTWATLCLMRALQSQGLSVVGMKPVATGAVWHEGRWVNEDALALRDAASIRLPYGQVNPYAFEPPVSPHIAAELAGESIDLARIVQIFDDLRQSADCVLVEGVGGWQAPLNRRERVSDLAVALDLPVILVVGLRLGCLNHALLTYESMRASGVRFAGWIANHVARDFPYAAENIQTIDLALGLAPLVRLPYFESSCQCAKDGFAPHEADEILRVLAP
ncbi:dethiobiotin synthase [Methylomagnum sp.]